jgi:hypothetical protein
MKSPPAPVFVFLVITVLFAGCGDKKTVTVNFEPPTASISSPFDGQTFVGGDTVVFAGSGTDYDDGALSGVALVWESDVDGPLGTGSFFSRDDLSVDTHSIRLTVTDSDGDTGAESVTIHIIQPPPLRVLFIGSSYFLYNDLPALFRGLATSGGHRTVVESACWGGWFLDDHAASPDTEAKIKSRKWDYVVLQGVCTNMAFPDTHHLIFPPYDRHDAVAAITALKQKIDAKWRGVKVVYCMPWAFEDGTTWLDGYNHDYFEMQQMVYDNTIRFSDDIGFVIAPVGWAWNEVMKIKTQLHYLFRADWNHPSLRGSYLMACVIYSTLLQEDTNGLGYHGGLWPDEARYFQSVASTIVLDDLELWNITP